MAFSWFSEQRPHSDKNVTIDNIQNSNLAYDFRELWKYFWHKASII